MALSLLFSSPLSSSSSSIFSTPYSSPMAFTASPIPRLHMKSMGHHHLKSCKSFCDISKKRGELIVKVSSDAEVVDSDEPQSESDDEEYFPLEKLPLDSKLQLKLEHKMRMKISKKIRLRRKKLVRKRRMRKTGRWPPSKMNKLKNV
ncbi:50S ribosomal protein 5 [Citrus sinensis]|nr:50S ribosomal protein 5 [Citrus sinensis]